MLVELFKQHLKVKSFVGENENATCIQTHVTIVIYWLIGIIKHKKTYGNVQLTKSCTFSDTLCWSRMIATICSSLLAWRLANLKKNNFTSTLNSINIY